jgi:hypothetical protein
MVVSAAEIWLVGRSGHDRAFLGAWSISDELWGVQCEGEGSGNLDPRRCIVRTGAVTDRGRRDWTCGLRHADI